MKTTEREVMQVANEAGVVTARRMARDHALRLGLSLVNQTKLVTAVSELARNMVVYAGSGKVTIEEVETGIKRGLRITFEDNGPGIPNLELAMRDGYTTGGGLGQGLPGARRLVNEFTIDSKVGVGTTVTIIKWK
jgi:serine/threonine-protein kinase RsbT